jgi:hypothetical protein
MQRERQTVIDSEKNINPLFLQLVLSLQSAAWYQMGKTVSPMSGKIERDLDQAKATIDLLAMLQEKTAGNLGKEEKQILDNTVYTLQMNYVDELEKDGGKGDNGSREPASAAGDTAQKPDDEGPKTAGEDKPSGGSADRPTED